LVATSFGTVTRKLMVSLCVFVRRFILIASSDLAALRRLIASVDATSHSVVVKIPIANKIASYYESSTRYFEFLDDYSAAATGTGCMSV
jgi:hypothetical protein